MLSVFLADLCDLIYFSQPILYLQSISHQHTVGWGTIYNIIILNHNNLPGFIMFFAKDVNIFLYIAMNCNIIPS